MGGYLSEEVKAHSYAWVVFGAVVMLLAGVLAILLPLATTTALSILLAWLVIAAGIGHLFAALRFESFGSFVWELLVGTVAIFAGAYMRTHPAMAPVSLTFVLAILLFVSGISEFALFSGIRSAPHAAWILANGAVDIIIGLIILRHWPTHSLWVLGMFVGISLMVAGLSRLIFSMRTGQRMPGNVPG